MPGVNLTDKERSHIIRRFQEIDDLDQLARLLNYIDKRLEKDDKTVKKVKAQHLSYLAQFKNDKYIEFKILKKNNGVRVIASPDKYLKKIQKLINVLISEVYFPHIHNSNHGFLIGRSVVSNALPHLNKKYILNIDIENFFPNISFRKVKTVLELPPFNLCGNREYIGFILSNICTFNGSLPQGAPTSPILSNIVTQKLDRRLVKYCIAKNIKYTRYADDLSFSCNYNLFDDRFFMIIDKILKKDRFTIKQSKTRIATSRDRQTVTGIVVNKHLNVKREYYQACRAMLNNWEKRGLVDATVVFNSNLPVEKRDKNYSFVNVLGGKINFVGQVVGIDNPRYLKLRHKYEYLKHKIEYNYIDSDYLKELLNNENRKMEMLIFDKWHSNNDRFIAFCTYAFHQVECLIMYYYHKQYNDMSLFSEYLAENNPEFKSNYKTQSQRKNLTAIRKFNLYHLIYLYEKENFYDKSISYNRRITLLREVRNDATHKFRLSSEDISKIENDYELLKKKWLKFKQKNNGKAPEKQKDEKQIELKYMVAKFVKKEDYESVRDTIIEISNVVESYLKKQVTG